MLSGYVGTVLLGGFFLSAGLFASGISRDQIVAFIVGLIIAVAFTLLGYDFISVQFDNWLPGVGSTLRDHVAVTKHFAKCLVTATWSRSVDPTPGSQLSNCTEMKS